MIRLTEKEIEIILQTKNKYFPPEYLLYLFGSRIHSQLKGGDIDLLIDCSHEVLSEIIFEKKVKFLTDLSISLNEIKIDLLLKCKGSENNLIVENALREAILLK